MTVYLGSEVVDVKDTEYKDYTQRDWAMYFIHRFGGIDGAHHKDWVLDQVARVLHDTPMVISVRKWDNGKSEYDCSTADAPSQSYKDWVIEMLGDYDDVNEEYEYSYDEGIAP